MSTVTTHVTKTRRNTELVLLAFAIGIVLLAYANVGMAVQDTVPADLGTLGIGIGVLALVFHLVLRWRAAYADPLLLPIATLLNGLGLVMIHRIDLAKGEDISEGFALRQLEWSALASIAAMVLLVLIKDHRLLSRYTFTLGLTGLGLLLLPLLPVIGKNVNGSRIWIGFGGFNLQPGEIAKITLTIFFAAYLVQTRDALSLVGRRVLGFPLPRARDLGPIMIAWLASLGVLVFQKDLGSSLLFFGLFVAMLYVATERRAWIAIGLTLFAVGTVVAWKLFAHLQERVTLWLDPFAPGQSDQIAKGLMGMAAGGMFGTGLGQGRPEETYYANSDFIMTSFGEELGLIGVMALLVLYALIVERGLRTGIGARDGFGKLLATGLAFSLALQVFVVVGGVTRVIPLTGLTTPFMSAGGSSLLANWVIVALLLRISDQARRPDVQESGNASIGQDETQVVKVR
ncbi:FtsW/RodA/SpoVE family cell cycle protein [Luteipulveratus sp. YIM 133132]|uniref:peptidoglycan glycosyltransferase n=1 Tax=Luteipulveratus flavus TaxID=3031728 RepID=A0ABT6C5G8_9MICO|nr:MULTISPECIES: FtsW/RodA/SpoVE family cell cycle protein [unclassified Luteipulveratus]MDE9364400.1 FtsW/RodA/SpoVE family cell cycle protein [Luteipulveratus sp. YIM 133132]MDF8263961.1 FtsW/RodA/SpoVE family cell cycle protein [Luteipulveratus sp. YIM 133296]